jgi:hypothetical protein
VQWHLASSWTAVIVLLAATAVVIVLGLTALARRSPYAARTGHVILSALICSGFFIPATVLYEKAYSGSAGFRVHIGDAAFARIWDLLLLIGSVWIALGIGWLAARILEARAPVGWSVRVARIRDLGLLLLLVGGVGTAFSMTTGPSLDSLLAFDISPFGLWALAEATPLGRLLWTRHRRRPDPGSSPGGSLDRFARGFLARYYWLVALAFPLALWGFSVANEELTN